MGAAISPRVPKNMLLNATRNASPAAPPAAGAVHPEPAGSAPADPADSVAFSPRAPSPTPTRRDVTVRVNEWHLCDEGTHYLVETSGCGAVKLFVQADGGDYSLVFHSFGTRESRESAERIARYVLGRGRPTAVRILSLQPYQVSPDAMRPVQDIGTALRQAGVGADVRAVCLNGVEGEMHSRFVQVDLHGTEEEILARYEHLVRKSPAMSPEDRAAKIRLFQSLPLQVRTPEFLGRWSSLTLDEARKVVQDLQEGEGRWSLGRLLGMLRPRKNEALGSP